MFMDYFKLDGVKFDDEVFCWNTSGRVIYQMKHKELKNEILLASNHTYMCGVTVT